MLRLHAAPAEIAGGHFEIFSRIEVRMPQNGAAD
jgi:hypothetical protein